MKGVSYILDETSSAKKLFGGIFRIASVCLFYAYLGRDWTDDVERDIINYLASGEDEESLSYAFANFVASLFQGVIGLWMIYWFFKGVYKVYTFNMYLDMFECKLTPYQKRFMTDINTDTSNIESALRYRDSLMKTLPTDKAAKLYLETNRFLGTATNKTTIDYINAKLGWMSNEQKINFLRGK